MNESLLNDITHVVLIALIIATVFVKLVIWYNNKFRQTRCPYNSKIKCSVRQLPCNHCYYYRNGTK